MDPHSGFLLEFVRPDHFASIVEFCASLRRDFHPCSFWGLTDQSVSQLCDVGNIAVVALMANRVCGLGLLSRGGEFQTHWAEISVAVAPEQRHHGIARAILENLETRASDAGISMIKALILENNSPSRSFFVRNGYEHRATLCDEFMLPGTGLQNDCVYYKWLKK
jgi:GNAT superfamily N-acetyltransferase